MKIDGRRAVALWRDGVFFFWAFATLVFVGAGGLGVSGSVGFIGLLWLPLLVWPVWRDIEQAPDLAGLAAMAVGWICASWFWSPYDRPDQLIKLALLTPLYALVPYGMARLSARVKARFGTYLLVLTVICGAYFAIDGLLDAPLATAFKTHLEGAEGSADAILELARKAASRGASAFILLAGPMAIFAWVSGRRIFAGVLAVTAGIAAASLHVEANLVALAAGTTVSAFAVQRPGQTLGALMLALAAFVLLAPFVIGLLVTVFPPGLAERLPLSWHMRLEIWANALRLIAESPIIGSGLDAGRVFDQSGTLRGVEMSLLPLHPHNAALNIWLDAGAVGAGLFAALLAATGLAMRRARWRRASAAGIAFAVTAWSVMVLLGYGLWQEWHHGALAIALGAAMLAPPPNRAR